MATGARVLVTGFEPFPGAPVNPTETLVAALRAEPPAFDGVAAFRAEILPVDFDAVGPRLSAIGRDFAPDIAIHFGLANECAGFRLERLARNRFLADRPDNAGVLREAGTVCDGAETFASRLPLEAIHARLAAMGLPVEWSDDAGGYLCNMVFVLSRAHACEGFAPGMSGFVHVPLTGEGAAFRLSDAGLLAGALAVVGECVEAWRMANSKWRVVISE
ncbi:pyroglutamyl-peptidase I [Aquibium carbonis]|uniref:Pyrrolidone-carboxylate peptidase n=1 Tax=Aquibium carbonis TaxID=2495581 RepID=A0A429Z170_9HYPH|nr:pyroglutamyl-peptidase I [Aquibium carbonis]RST87384.1 pyroglutamyl-peptidase I [Aquibium carbonis]